MAEGTIKWFDAKKGYGFITGENGEDIFVHYSAIEMDGFKTLDKGDPVSYELTQGPKGLHAKNVQRSQMQ